MAAIPMMIKINKKRTKRENIDRQKISRAIVDVWKPDLSWFQTPKNANSSNVWNTDKISCLGHFWPLVETVLNDINGPPYSWNPVQPFAWILDKSGFWTSVFLDIYCIGEKNSWERQKICRFFVYYLFYFTICYVDVLPHFILSLGEKGFFMLYTICLGEWDFLVFVTGQI